MRLGVRRRRAIRHAFAENSCSLVAGGVHSPGASPLDDGHPMPWQSNETRTFQPVGTQSLAGSDR